MPSYVSAAGDPIYFETWKGSSASFEEEKTLS